MSSANSVADLFGSLSIPKPGQIAARLWCHGITRSSQVTEAYLPVIDETLDSPPSATGRLALEKITKYVLESASKIEAPRAQPSDRPVLKPPDDDHSEWSSMFEKPRLILVRLVTIGVTKISDLVTVSEKMGSTIFDPCLSVLMVLAVVELSVSFDSSTASLVIILHDHAHLHLMDVMAFSHHCITRQAAKT